MSHHADPSAADPCPSAATPRDAPRRGCPPLRLQVVSDLHFDATPYALPHAVPGVDAVVVSGDTCQGAEKAFAYLRAAFPPPVPLVVVLGNREFHGRAVLDETRRARAIAPDYGITLLDDGQAFIGDVRFIGGTLWADFRLHGEAAQAEAIAAAAGHGDHVRIALTRIPYRRFTPLDAVNRFEATSAYLSTRLGERFDRPTVVVTHHAPSARSLDPRLLGAGRDASYASSLDRMIVGAAPALWLHGHVHRSCDYGLCRTRIVCNAKVLISTEI